MGFLRTKSALTTISTATILVAPTSAVELADLAGDWNLAALESPARLRETYYNTVTMTGRTTEDSSGSAMVDEILANAFYPDPSLAETKTFAIAGDGTVSGGESGTILSLSSNRLVFDDGSEITTLYTNTTGSVLLTGSADVDQQDLTLCTKRPASLTTAELTGDWGVVFLNTPDDLEKTFASGQLADVYFVDEAEAGAASVSINGGAGTFSGDFSGTISATGPGDVTLDDGEGPLPLKINEAKDVMFSAVQQPDEASYVAMVRKPAALATSDLAGTWRVVVMTLPNSLTESFYNTVTTGSRQADSSGVAGTNEVLVDLFHIGNFDLGLYELLVTSGGAVSGSLTGTFTANGDKSVSLNIGGDITNLFINADKTVMISGGVDSDENSLIVAVKTSAGTAASFADRADLGIFRSGSTILLNWNGASTIQLQEYIPPTGWSLIPDTAGLSSYAVTASGGSELFRVVENP